MESRTISMMVMALAAMFVAASAAGIAGEVPMILAHKKATLNRLKSGAERISVSIDIYNQGPSTAFELSLVDDHWPQDMFTLVTGNTSQSWERLDAGGILSHSFVLEAKTKGLFQGSPALIKFRIQTQSAFQEAYSSPIPPLDVLADRPPEKKFEWAKRLLAKYGSQVSVIGIIVSFVYLVAASPKSSSAKGSKKRR